MFIAAHHHFIFAISAQRHDNGIIRVLKHTPNESKLNRDANKINTDLEDILEEISMLHANKAAQIPVMKRIKSVKKTISKRPVIMLAQTPSYEKMPVTYKECNNSKQSPINIETSKLEYQNTLKPFKFIEYGQNVEWKVSSYALKGKLLLLFFSGHLNLLHITKLA